MLNLGVIGYGYWGPNLVRNFMEIPGARVAMVSDLDAQRLARVTARYPTVQTTRDAGELIRNPAVDAVVVATPVSTHAELALRALRAGKHVLVEKPMAASSADARRMIAAAARHQRVLMVDHTFVYTGAVRRMRELIASRALGEIYYYDSVRVNLGLFQRDVNVIWDLAVHDLSIMDYVLGRPAQAVSATGMSHMAGHPENIAYITVFFGGGLLAHFHVNWLAPVKIRRTLVAGSAKMIVFDDLEPSEKLKVYDKGLTVSRKPADQYQMRIGYRAGDMWAPYVEPTEALRAEALHFVDCVAHGATPLTDGAAGLRVVRVLEAASRSARQQGRLVRLARSAR